MKFKKDASVSTNDFWYDLTDGGYINPRDLLEDEADIEKINDAIAIVEDFRNEMEEKEILEWK